MTGKKKIQKERRLVYVLKFKPDAHNNVYPGACEARGAVEHAKNRFPVKGQRVKRVPDCGHDTL